MRQAWHHHRVRGFAERSGEDRQEGRQARLRAARLGPPRRPAVSETTPKHSVTRVAGPVVEATGMAQAVMHEMVEVGNDRLIGEIIRLEGEQATIQVYQNTTGLKLDEPVLGTGSPLSVELAPGIVGKVFDGIQRPLEELKNLTGAFIKQAAGVKSLSRNKKWTFVPTAKVGDKLVGGDILGTVQETALFEHRILVPVNIQGKLVKIAPKGDYTITETIATIESNGTKVDLPMLQKWPVREPRPHNRQVVCFFSINHWTTCYRHFLPRSQRWKCLYPWTIRLRKNCNSTAIGEVVRCQHHHLRWMRRTG